MIIVKKTPDTMLKNIRLHIEKDEEKQHELEQKLAKSVLACQSKNINSFARNIPSLLPLVQHPIMQNHSLFCNKFGEINIVDYGIGRTLYGFHPQAEISKQVANFIQYAPYVDLSGQNNSDISEINHEQLCFESSFGYLNRQTFTPCPNEIECLVVLGCGLGMHILELLQTRKIQNIIIYEPELQYFQCSSLVNKWYEIFALAQQQKSQIFIQVQKDGRDIISDINELTEHKNISGFYLYQHYNHPVFNSLLKELTSKSWKNIQEQGITFAHSENYNHYVPVWTPNIELEKITGVSKSSPLLAKNLGALKKYFPNIHAEFIDYQPKIWMPVVNHLGEINVVKADSLTPWYSDHPKQDCEFNYNNFNEQPHKDGLVLGYNGTKLAHYLHYQFVKQTEELLAKAEEDVGALPDNIASIIMFGVGVGYQVETLLQHHTVEKLFLCEPNSDFFYASLFAIDWLNIFETIDKTDARIYLNIGDDGSHLFRDLLGQFHSIGPYILNNTYFYQSYYNASLNSAITQLREQLQIVISMGEYFDHAYYGIEHTKEGMRRNYPLLVKNPNSKLSYDDKEVPVFIVGNGPSLDNSIEAIKEWQGQAIIISCGTALQALYRNGIKPDFHAEIEQNRSTFDWAVLIGDLEYLKKITLITCNGIHPDTGALYKDVLIAFKEGESSTVSTLSVLGQHHFEVLQHAFPTVSNFVTNIVRVIGFNHIYLMGVDLGFVDVKHHHSKSSGYYHEDGNETYNYSERNNTSLMVPGNFRPCVNTKHEFKMSRQIIEQVTQQKSKEQTFYNCSDGAKIQGTNPLHIDNLLIMSTISQKQQALTQLKSSIFTTEHSSKFIERYENKFSHTLLIQELEAFEALLTQDIRTPEQAHKLINKQKEMLFASYKNGCSLLFYYLYGTVNYANAVLTKLSSQISHENELTQPSQHAIAVWLKTVRLLKKFVMLNENIHYFDTSGFKIWQREQLMIPTSVGDKSLLTVSKNVIFQKCINWQITNKMSFIKDITVATEIEDRDTTKKYDFIIYYENDALIEISGQHNTMVITHSDDISIIKNKKHCYFSIPKIDDNSILNNMASITTMAVRACLCNDYVSFIIPKLLTSDESLFGNKTLYIVPEGYIAIDFIHFICVKEKNNVGLTSFYSGTRGKIIIGDIKMKDLLLTISTQERLDGLKQKHSEITS
jgi:hypothetical protein